MSNEENRQTPQPYYSPQGGGMPGAGYPQGAQGAGFPQGAPGYSPNFPPGYGQSPYQQQVPAGYPMGGPMPQFPGQQMPPTTDVPGMLPVEESYIENILRLNKGKIATVYMTFENNERWNAKIFKGVIEAAGRDHIILSDPETGKRYLLLMIYLDYITFDEELNYEYPYAAGGADTVSYPPR
ncbi:spore coat protein GerQ [Aquibacillus albus]|uniref:Spore germination protein Q n=1 Tax=Aquibacillus albus TaxID=1168171 RepID=A0ABS2MXD8_9BACI|nr:spore coat protein GerQ [Aquibacillus albus]MBM7570511.1 spore germination protein Q [Aquibacillus albus]